MLFNRAIVQICSFIERWNVTFNTAWASLNRTFHLSTHEHIRTIALINIHYVYNNLQDGTPTSRTFEHIPSEMGAEEAEEVGVEHLLR